MWSLLLQTLALALSVGAVGYFECYFRESRIEKRYQINAYCDRVIRERLQEERAQWQRTCTCGAAVS